MCPACMANAVLMASSVMSTSGIAALAVKMIRGRKSLHGNNSKNMTERRNDDDDHDDEKKGTGHSGVAS